MKAIEVKNLQISYRTIQAKSILKSLFSLKKSKVGYFRAIKNVSFSIDSGEIVGLIGKNGSGKSTLLRSIAGVFSPDNGSINLFGNTVSLLAIGVGFKKELTGRENIYLSGLLMGFSEKEIDKKYEEIVRFSELGDFIDKPVQTYSSGMHSKLAFAITSILEADIMLIDETLSVGDIKFKKKSKQKMHELISDENRTVVIVSHSVATLKELCTRGIWIDDGVVRMDGPIDAVLDEYTAYMDDSAGTISEKEQKTIDRMRAKHLFEKTKKLPVEPNHIMFFPGNGKYSENEKYIYEKIKEIRPDWKCTWVAQEGIESEFPNDVSTVMFKSEEYFRALNSAHILIDGRFNFLKSTFSKKPEQVYIHTYGASFGYRRLSFSDIAQNKKLGRVVKSAGMADIVISNSEFKNELLKTSYWPNTEIEMLGHARSDVLLCDDKKRAEISDRIRSRYNIDKNSKLVVASFDNQENTKLCDSERLIAALKDRLGGDWTILFLESAPQNIVDNARDLNKHADKTEILAIADFLVGDYNRNSFDFIFTKKPGVMLLPEIDKDKKNNNYYDITSLPFGTCRDENEVINYIENIDTNDFERKANTFISERGCIDDGHSSERIVQYIDKIVNKSTIL